MEGQFAKDIMKTLPTLEWFFVMKESNSALQKPLFQTQGMFVLLLKAAGLFQSQRKEAVPCEAACLASGKV